MSLMDFDRGIMRQGYPIIAGADEAGRGPLAGPVFACAIIMREDQTIDAVNDSKKLSEKKREELYDVILEHAVDYCVASVDEKVIDEMNILNATMLAFKNALDGLKKVPDLSLIDGNQDRGITIPHRCIIKGDANSYHIAAASIIAKVSRDRYIRKQASLYPQYGFEQHKGYGTKAHIEAIQQYGLCDIHRKTFCTKFVKGE